VDLVVIDIELEVDSLFFLNQKVSLVILMNTFALFDQPLLI